MNKILSPIFFFIFFQNGVAQHISNFISVQPTTQTTNFIFPNSHRFQKLIEEGDSIVNGVARDNFDFTGFVSNNNSNINGFLSLNHELVVDAGITAFDIQFDTATKLWNMNNGTILDFYANNLGGTYRNCSAGITPWGNVITCEEYQGGFVDSNADGYNDLGWHVETNPASKTVINKLWALGQGSKENICVHSNRQTCYFGNDAFPGYLYKFVADNMNDLNSGILYVYTGSKAGNGTWTQIANTTITERNSTMTQCANIGATIFNGVEDVEIGTDGKIYVAVKNENCVYRFEDSDPLIGTTVSNFETYVGNANYTITHSTGISTVAWGTGNDNLAFDDSGNLWVLQDGGNNYIWLVKNGHTQASPNVHLFGIAPAGSEPTGITFSLDYKFLFMSFQHPSVTNNIDYQKDANGLDIGFGKDIAIVISLAQNLGCAIQGQSCNDSNPNTINDIYNSLCNCAGTPLPPNLNINNVGVGTSAPKTKLHIKEGDIYSESIGTGMILKSANGTCWKITVDNNGNIQTQSVVCPN